MILYFCQQMRPDSTKENRQLFLFSVSNWHILIHNRAKIFCLQKQLLLNKHPVKDHDMFVQNDNGIFNEEINAKQKSKSTELVENMEDTEVADNMENKDVSHWSKRKTATLQTESIIVGNSQNTEDREDKNVYF